MQHDTEMRRCLLDIDVAGVKALWAHLAPHLPQPDDAQALAALHVARTAAESMPLAKRAYSHRWLTERNLPSQLPDRLKPSAERLYPETVGAVGISANSKHLAVKQGVQEAMQNAVEDCYANGDTDPLIVKPRMMEARAKELRGLNYDRRGWR